MWLVQIKQEKQLVVIGCNRWLHAREYVMSGLYYCTDQDLKAIGYNRLVQREYVMIHFYCCADQDR